MSTPIAKLKRVFLLCLLASACAPLDSEAMEEEELEGASEALLSSNVVAGDLSLSPDATGTTYNAESLSDAMRRFGWVSGPCAFRGTRCTCTQTPDTCNKAGGTEEYCYSCCGKSCSTPSNGHVADNDLTDPILSAH